MGLPGQLGGYDTRLGLASLGGSPTVGDLIEMSPGLVAHFRLDETSGTTAHDYLLAHDGTISGSPSFVSSNVPDPGAISLPTSSEHISAAGTINIATGAVELWFRLASLPTGANLGLIAGFYDSSSKYDKCLYVDSGGFLYWLVNDGSAKTIKSTFTIAVGRIYHAAGLADGTHSTLVINGVQNGQIAASNTIATYSASGNFYIGGGTSGTFVAQPGTYDETAIFSTVPTVNAINQRWLTGLQNITQTNARVTEYAAEVLRDSSTRNARVTQYAAEVARDSSTRNARVTSLSVEVLCLSGSVYTPSASNSITVTTSGVTSRDRPASSTTSFTLTSAGTEVDARFYTVAAESDFTLTSAGSEINPRSYDASAESDFTVGCSGDESVAVYLTASSGFSIFSSGSDADYPGHNLSATTAISLSVSDVTARIGLASAESSFRFTYAGSSTGDRFVSAESDITVSQDLAPYSQFDLFVAGANSLAIGQTGAKMGDFNLYAASIVRMTNPGRCYVSPIPLFASTNVLLAGRSSLTSLEILSLSASSGVKLGSSAKTSGDRSLSASSSMTVSSASGESRAIYVSATTGLSITLGDGSNKFFGASGQSTVGIGGTAGLALSATLASSGVVFTDLALAVVWLPWRPNGLTRPPGGGLPHS